ncbi:MAG: hypothetical protein ACHQ01_05230 [Candidatus Limnocylindrales bacterium]
MALPSVGRYRRRFIVEYGPEDSALMDRMGVAHKTKRAAILAGLRLLDSDESDQLRARIARLETDLSAAKASAVATGAQAQQSTSDRIQAVADVRAERTAHRETRAKLQTARSMITDLKVSVGQLERERARIDALVPRHAFCGACGKLVPEAEWAETPARDGFDVYHKADGYRAKPGILAGPATVLFWRKTAGLPLNPRGASR